MRRRSTARPRRRTSSRRIERDVLLGTVMRARLVQRDVERMLAVRRSVLRVCLCLRVRMVLLVGMLRRHVLLLLLLVCVRRLIRVRVRRLRRHRVDRRARLCVLRLLLGMPRIDRKIISDDPRGLDRRQCRRRRAPCPRA